MYRSIVIIVNSLNAWITISLLPFAVIPVCTCSPALAMRSTVILRIAPVQKIIKLFHTEITSPHTLHPHHNLPILHLIAQYIKSHVLFSFSSTSSSYSLLEVKNLLKAYFSVLFYLLQANHTHRLRQ